MTSFSAAALLRLMALAREGDRREGILVRQGRGWFQLPGAGHEGMAALASLLTDNDYLFPHYRDRALMLARGVSNYEIALGFFGKSESSSGGRQLSSHWSDAARNIVSLASPTGLQCLPAAGAAWACKMEEQSHIALCCLGEASTRQGEYYEALCFAVQEKLPLVLVVEDNGYGISTPTARLNPYALGALGEAHLQCVDGHNVRAVYEAGRIAIERARNGDGPSVLWLEVDRLFSHTSSDDHRVYRCTAELDSMAERDLVLRLQNELVASGELNIEYWKAECESIAREVDDDYRRAEVALNPDASRAAEHTFAAALPEKQTSGLPPRDEWTMLDAVNETLRAALAANEKVLLFGEDIEDPKGGVFGLTKGLSSQFPNRVVNSPLAEATIAGLAAGLALAGWRPVFELQSIDFCGPAFNQIVNQIATLRWRSAGAWRCPVVLLAPCGAYLPGGGPWHSQTNESWFAHAPGLQVAMPSTPHDAAALLRLAIAGDDPVLLLLPKHLFRQKFATQPDEPFTLGQARVCAMGSDVTIAAWGNCVEVALQARDELRTEGVSAEVLDLRSIVPCDWESLHHSLEKTGRLVVVQEDNRTCSFGQSIIAEMTSRNASWDCFAAAPQLVSRADVHIGFHPDLEAAVLPNVEQVCAAVRRTLES